MTATTAQYMNAKNDTDLLTRFVAKAELMGVEGASSLIHNNYAKLLTTEVGGGQTIVDVHAYADEVRKTYIAATPVPPGQNPGAVTDAYLEVAINSLIPEAPPATN